MPMLLALDTATEACSVALHLGDEIIYRYEIAPRLHAQRVLPMVQELLAEAGKRPAQIDAIAFGRGPGAFTGVRIAIGVVQGLAFGLDRPVLPVSNLALLAQRAWREQGAAQVAAAIDARMDEVYWGCYALVEHEMRLRGEEAVLRPEAIVLPAGATGEWFGAGTGWGYAERMAVPVLERDATLLPHAYDLAVLAMAGWRRDEAVAADSDAAQPVYLRDRVATPKAAT